MADFAVDVAVGFRKGSARGERSQLASMGMTRDNLMKVLGQCLSRTITAHRARFERRRSMLADGSRAHPAFQIARGKSEAKSRWVNGTPEYARQLGALRKLFPDALFIHLLRNVDEVVRSLLHFHRVAGDQLVENEEQAYRYWTQSVRACADAEQAYGRAVVCRMHYEQLVTEPEKAIHTLLDFVGENFAAACLEPLSKRINSSNVAEYPCENDPQTDPGVILEARELWKELKQTLPPASPSLAAAKKVEEDFEQRVAYVLALDGYYAKAQRIITDLQRQCSERTEWALRCDQDIVAKDACIVQLQRELEERPRWVEGLSKESTSKDEIIRGLQDELASRAEWAEELSKESTRKDEIVRDLQDELATRAEWAEELSRQSERKDETIRGLQDDLQDRTAWAQNLNDEVARKDATILRMQLEFDERTAWALQLDADSVRKDAIILELRKQLSLAKLAGPRPAPPNE